EAAHYTRVLCEDVAALPKETIRGSGYVVDCLESALWCLLNTESYRDCVLAAVNLGDDTDTTAAVAGGLAGLLYGSEGIPADWLAAILRRDGIEDLCRKAARSWCGGD
ncbi:MAG: ADP-ribosylglycohydrolase family protein, partial [Clostridia bacterium]|nr:ADP-ribosylglycohydrolase family protein [Clostridia bacterium]